ncbi:MAG: succinylglutamate desuccinylase/aspartoacylase family protein [Pirellulales bacterium]
MLKQLEISGHASGPNLLVFGGVHGDEFEPMAAIRRLAQELNPAELRGKVTLVPVVNEPAFFRGSRTAEDGLDLARTFPGKPDGSVTERIAHAATALIAAADYFIDLHTGGSQFGILPLAGYGLVPQQPLLDTQRRMARAFNLPVVWGTDWRLNGRSLSAARDAGVPAIYAEYHGSAVCDPAGVAAYVAGCLNVMAELGLLDRPRPPSRVKYFVEDDRPSAGHLQICHPAPITGFFEPAVQLGQAINAGEPLGTVCDILGQQIKTIPAAETGIILLLNTFSRVKQGDSVAVILPKERMKDEG